MRRWIAGVGLLVVLGAGCGDDTSTTEAGARPTVVVTTSILGDVVRHLVGDQLEVITIMPVGTSPHEFQASPRDAQRMREARLLITNGRGFEEGLLEVIEAAREDGVRVYAAADALPGDEPALEEDAEAEDERGHAAGDPHFFTDPVLMAEAAEGILDEVVDVFPDLDRQPGEAYLDALADLHEEVEAILAPVPPERRVLVTNHDVMHAFSDRYRFEVAGTVIPGGSTSEGTSAGELAKLADLVREHQVPAVFVDASSSRDLAETLAQEVGDVAVVELFTESLGQEGSGGATYVEMIRTNAERIAEALR